MLLVGGGILAGGVMGSRCLVGIFEGENLRAQVI